MLMDKPVRICRYSGILDLAVDALGGVRDSSRTFVKATRRVNTVT